jgi:7-carboxy-7-deazaguanine synthase
MKINEIFFSVQGEGLCSGLPTIFIRTTGCNLRCSYCDTKYAYCEGKETSIDDILSEISKFDCNRICITGGEPLMQQNLIELLQRLKKYSVSIETNGSLSIAHLPKEVMISLDIKCPSSGQTSKMKLENLDLLKDSDQVKFIMDTKEDYDFAKSIVLSKKVSNAIFSPVGGLNAKEIVDNLLKDGLNDVRVGLQIHKIIWNPQKRGV